MNSIELVTEIGASVIPGVGQAMDGGMGKSVSSTVDTHSPCTSGIYSGCKIVPIHL